MSALLAWLTSKFAGVAAGAAFAVALLFKVRRDAVLNDRMKRRVEELEDAAETRKEIDDAIEESNAGDSDWRERVRKLRETRANRDL